MPIFTRQEGVRTKCETPARKKLIAALFGCGLLTSVSALAVNGADDYGFSEIMRGMGAILYFSTISYAATRYSPGVVSNIAATPGFHDSSVPIFFLPDFGMNFPINSKSSAGISYQPEVYMTKLREYTGLFPNSGECNYPPFGNIGLAPHLTNPLVLASDVEEIWFKDIENYGASHDALLNSMCAVNTSTCLGGSNDAGFGWGNDTIFKIGIQWTVNFHTTLRADFNYGTQVLGNHYATENMITPVALIQDAYSLGAMQTISEKDFINGVLTLIPVQTFTSRNLFSSAENQTVTLVARGFGFGVSWSKMFA